MNTNISNKNTNNVPTHKCRHCKKDNMPNDWDSICLDCYKTGCRKCMKFLHIGRDNTFPGYFKHNRCA